MKAPQDVGIEKRGEAEEYEQKGVLLNSSPPVSSQEY